MGVRKRAGALVLAVAGVVPAIAIAGSPAEAAQNVTVIDERTVCVLPRPNNNGRVLGHDSGWSLDAGTYVYHFFGDTYVDRNGDGVYSGLGDFGTGTVARTTDKNASDCVNLDYKTSYTEPTTATGLAVAAIQVGGVGAPAHECLTWPESGVVAAGKIYVYYTSVQKQNCGNASETPVYQVGIAEMAANMNFTRRGILWTGTDQRYTAPLKIGSNVYTFGMDAAKNLKIARVFEYSITTKTSYTPLPSGWTVDPNADGGPPSIAFNANLNRFLAVYSCGIASQICARVASTTGQTETALRGAWNAPVVLRSCGYAFACGHVGQHPGYASGSRVYISTARHDGAYGLTPPRPEYRYWNTLRMYDLSMTASKPSYRSFGDSELQFSSTQGGNGWYYRRGLTGPNLTYNTGSYSWLGTESVAGSVVPRVFADGATPGPTQVADRVRKFPTAGTVTINYEVRLQRNCGNGVNWSLYRIRGGLASQMRVPVLLDPGWSPARSTSVYDWTVAVNAGDEILFRLLSRNDASCDSTVTFVSYTYDATG